MNLSIVPLISTLCDFMYFIQTLYKVEFTKLGRGREGVSLLDREKISDKSVSLGHCRTKLC